MTSRQIGHFFFEAQRLRCRKRTPVQKHKEEIKVGYNLRRKVAAAGDLGDVNRFRSIRPDLFRNSLLTRTARSWCGTSRKSGLSSGRRTALLFRTAPDFTSSRISEQGGWGPKS